MRGTVALGTPAGRSPCALGSRRVMRDFDLVIARPGERLARVIALLYDRGLELVSGLDEAGDVRSTISNRRVAIARLRLDAPASASFYDRKDGLRVDILFDFPLTAAELTENATQLRIRSHRFLVASERTSSASRRSRARSAPRRATSRTSPFSNRAFERWTRRFAAGNRRERQPGGWHLFRARRADHEPSARTRATTPARSRPTINTGPIRTASLAASSVGTPTSRAKVTRRFGVRRSRCLTVLEANSLPDKPRRLVHPAPPLREMQLRPGARLSSRRTRARSYVRASGVARAGRSSRTAARGGG